MSGKTHRKGKEVEEAPGLERVGKGEPGRTPCLTTAQGEEPATGRVYQCLRVFCLSPKDWHFARNLKHQENMVI